MYLSIISILFSIYIIWKISTSFDLAANFLTRNMAEGIKGPTINAAASSLPELIISSMFLFYYKDVLGFSSGYATIIGSSAFNIACIPVISYLFLYAKNNKVYLRIDQNVILEDTFFLILSFIVLFLGFFFGLSFFISASLIIIYIIYILYVYYKRSNRIISKVKEELNVEQKSVKHDSSNLFLSILNLRIFLIFFKNKISFKSSLFVILLSVVLIGFSCHVLISAVAVISNIYSINLFFTSFIIVAIASSIPDTILSVYDAKNNRFVDAFSNAYASNIFDICIGLGLPLMVYTFIYGTIDLNIPIERIGFLGDTILNGNLFLWSLILLCCFTFVASSIYYFKSLNIKISVLLFVLYIAYVFLLVIF